MKAAIRIAGEIKEIFETEGDHHTK